MAPAEPLGTSMYRVRERAHVARDASVHAASKLVARSDKPWSMSSMSVVIAVCVTVPVVIALVVLFWLHRRNVKRQRIEDAKDPHRDLDFGLDEGLGAEGGRKKKGRRSLMLGGEKATHKTNQLSMDMNLESPYLLPPQVQGSHDSVHSLTRTANTEFDPYRMVNSECGGSVRSFRDPADPNKRASVITGRSNHSGKFPPPPRQGSFPRTPFSPDADSATQSTSEKSDPFGTPPPASQATQQSGGSKPELQQPMVPIKPVVPEIDNVPYPDDESSHRPGPAISDTSLPPNHQNDGQFNPDHDGIGMAHGGDVNGRQDSRQGAGLGLNVDFPPPVASPTDSVYPDQPPAISGNGVAMHDRFSKESHYGYQDYYPQIQTSAYHDEGADFGHGGAKQGAPGAAYSDQPQGLGVPQQESKRLSVGFRPLPPDEVTESEDPEYRANRIRSFYKEYFDDSKEAPPPMPNGPNDYGGGGGYYEDYDDQYLQDAAYFDPETNAFVMPGAQPVHRRAMTPPPNNRRGPPGPPGHGPRGPPGGRRGGPRPHGPHGSVGNMSLPGGRRPRAGSAWDGRAPSSLGPRPGSSASARGRQTPKKNLPPPSALNTLPTPSKLRDDSFALFNATDFAPPETFQERARGRSQSPLGERRAYSPKVPSASPLVTSYDELNALPSPHDLRKSKTFTNLDFLPPKKFKDADSMSDAGSIRSNRSGISSAAASAIRGGAGRVSRLPTDTVFTQHVMATELKPQWGMRP